MSATNIPSFNLSDFDIKLLRIFQTIVRCNGLSSAQPSLGLALPTISSYLKQLEGRLGLTLCYRGRSGFSLTAEGEDVYEATNSLFSSLTNFQDKITTLRGTFSGSLTLGTVDAITTLNDSRLVDGIKLFDSQAEQIRLIVDIASPQELLNGLTGHYYDCILTPIKPDHDGVTCARLFSESHRIYCSTNHYLLSLTTAREVLDSLESETIIGRSYMSTPNINHGYSLRPSAVVSHMESAVLLILTGHYIGYLPEHYGYIWEEKNMIQKILPNMLNFENDFYLATTTNHESRLAKLFYQSLLKTFSKNVN